jgi:hypothetical protein
MWCVCVCVCVVFVRAGISTDVALTVTENAVGIRRVQSHMEELEKKMTDMHNMIKTAVLGSSFVFRSCSWGLSFAALATCLCLGLSHHCTWRPPDPRDSFLYALTLSHVQLVRA